MTAGSCAAVRHFLAESASCLVAAFCLLSFILSFAGDMFSTTAAMAALLVSSSGFQAYSLCFYRRMRVSLIVMFQCIMVGPVVSWWNGRRVGGFCDGTCFGARSSSQLLK